MSHFTESPKWGGHNAGKISPRNCGSGPVFWVRDALGDTREQFAPRMGASTKQIENWELRGLAPTRNITHRAELLGLAHTIPACDLTPELRGYMEAELAYFEKLKKQLEGMKG